MLEIRIQKLYGTNMKKAILTLLLVFGAAHCAANVHAAPGDSGSTTGWTNDAVNQSLAEEFARCSAFSGIAAECAKKDTQEQRKNAAAGYEDAAKRFYKGSYMLAGQEFTRKRIRHHDTALRRNAGNACEGFPKLEQQYQKRCDNSAKRLPRSLQ
jgi:hypothetical protein